MDVDTLSDGGVPDIRASVSKDIKIYQQIQAEKSSAPPTLVKGDRPDARQRTAGLWWTAALFIFLSHLVVVWMVVVRRGASWSIIAVTVFQAWLQLLGITAGAHRLWSHRAFQATLPLRAFLAIIQLQSFQGSAYWWAMRHRVHHRFTDTAEDPYDSTKGLWYSHMGWLFTPPPKFSKMSLIGNHDLNTDPVIVAQRKYLLLGYIVFGGIYPAVLGHWLSGDWRGGLLWIGVVARFISWHGIWTINSFSHWHGPRDFSVRATAVHSWFLAILQNGEGHHSYHHQFPSDYRHGTQSWDWDPTKWCIQLWAKLGLAYDLVETPTRQSEGLRAHVLRQKAAMIEREFGGARSSSDDIDQSLPTMTVAQFINDCQQHHYPWIIIDRLVIDVSTFESHPGGQTILRAYYGKDASRAFHVTVNQHTEAAEYLMRQFAIARISDERDAKKE